MNDSADAHVTTRERIHPLSALAALAGIAALAAALWRSGGAAPEAPPAGGPLASAPAAPAPDAGRRPAAGAAQVAPVVAPVSPALRPVADRGLAQRDRLRPLVDGSLTSVAQASDIALLRNVLRDPADDDTIRNEAANLLRASACADLADDLRAVLAEPREQARFRSFAAQHLGVLLLDARRAGAAEADVLRRDLTAALRDRHVEVRREALLALSRGGAADALAEVERLIAADGGAPMHDLCVRIAAEQGWRELLPRIRAFAVAGDPVVRVAALSALGAMRDAQSRALLDAASADGDRHVAGAARAALAMLTASSPEKP